MRRWLHGWGVVGWMDIKAVLRTAITTVIKVTNFCSGFHSLIFIFFKMNEKVQAKYAKVRKSTSKVQKERTWQHKIYIFILD